MKRANIERFDFRTPPTAETLEEVKTAAKLEGEVEAGYAEAIELVKKFCANRPDCRFVFNPEFSNDHKRFFIGYGKEGHWTQFTLKETVVDGKLVSVGIYDDIRRKELTIKIVEPELSAAQKLAAEIMAKLPEGTLQFKGAGEAKNGGLALHYDAGDSCVSVVEVFTDEDNYILDHVNLISGYGDDKSVETFTFRKHSDAETGGSEEDADDENVFDLLSKVEELNDVEADIHSLEGSDMTELEREEYRCDGYKFILSRFARGEVCDYPVKKIANALRRFEIWESTGRASCPWAIKNIHGTILFEGRNADDFKKIFEPEDALTFETINGEEVAWFKGECTHIISPKYDAAYSTLNGAHLLVRNQGRLWQDAKKFNIGDRGFFELMQERGACTIEPSDYETSIRLTYEFRAVVGGKEFDVTAQNGKRRAMSFGATEVTPAWDADKGFVITDGFDTYAYYETAAQVEYVIAFLKNNISQDSATVIFPTVDQLRIMQDDCGIKYNPTLKGGDDMTAADKMMAALEEHHEAVRVKWRAASNRHTAAFNAWTAAEDRFLIAFADTSNDDYLALEKVAKELHDAERKARAEMDEAYAKWQASCEALEVARNVHTKCEIAVLRGKAV